MEKKKRDVLLACVNECKRLGMSDDCIHQKALSVVFVIFILMIVSPLLFEL